MLGCLITASPNDVIDNRDICSVAPREPLCFIPAQPKSCPLVCLLFDKSRPVLRTSDIPAGHRNFVCATRSKDPPCFSRKLIGYQIDNFLRHFSLACPFST